MVKLIDAYNILSFRGIRALMSIVDDIVLFSNYLILFGGSFMEVSYHRKMNLGLGCLTFFYDSIALE